MLAKLLIISSLREANSIFAKWIQIWKKGIWQLKGQIGAPNKRFFTPLGRRRAGEGTPAARGREHQARVPIGASLGHAEGA